MPMKSIPKQPDWISPHSCGPQSSQLQAPPLACGRCGKGAIPDVDARAGGESSLGKKKISVPAECRVYLCTGTILFSYGIPLPRYAVRFRSCSRRWECSPVMGGGPKRAGISRWRWSRGGIFLARRFRAGEILPLKGWFSYCIFIRGSFYRLGISMRYVQSAPCMACRLRHAPRNRS
jgi:hypothetical protein